MFSMSDVIDFIGFSAPSDKDAKTDEGGHQEI